MISIKPLPSMMTMKDPAVLIATGLGSGRLAPAPGTWGTAAAWVIGLMLMSQGKAVIALAIAASIIAGLWAVEKFEAACGSHDNGMIVIDEWAGIWVTLLLAAPFWDQLILGFAVFRLFDIWKPWPIRWLDKNVAGAWGVMIDDIVAGLAAGLCVYGYGLWTLS